MDWEQLLNSQRIHGHSKNKLKSTGYYRSEFDKDVQRIFFSYPFRRLQNKTQVIPIPVFDFIHTRLTHSLEVASVGNILGRIVGKNIIQRNKKNRSFQQFYKREKLSEFDFGAITQAACLAHDIGNPPFGHSGEDSISDYFNKLDNYDIYRPFFFSKEDDNIDIKKRKIKGLSIKHWHDLSQFDGNAMGFRIINNKHYAGFNLTLATLAAFTKYPRESYIIPEHNKNLIQTNNRNPRSSQKKFGFFQSEKEIFKKVADINDGVGLILLGDENNLSWCRHPLAFLVEAADDVCNLLVDLEDGFRLGRFNFEEVSEILNQVASINIKNHNVYRLLEDEKEKVGYLKNKALTKLTFSIAKTFLENEKAILSGKYDIPLIDDIKYVSTKERISKLLKTRLYPYKPILELETVGFEVIGGLLHMFILAVTEDSNLSPKHRQKLLQLIPPQFQLTNQENRIQKNLYLKIIKIIDFVSGMTDTYAIHLYRSLKGIDIPKIQNLI